MCNNESKYNIYSNGRSYGYDKRGGWDIDTSDKTQRESDSGHIPGRYQWEETIDVSAEYDTDSDSNDDSGNDSSNDSDNNDA